jgi:LysM domain
MPITHAEAQRLLNLASDKTLKDYQKQILDSHLESCTQCQEYTTSIEKMESVLQPLLQRQWNQQLTPLSVDQLLSRGNPKIVNITLLATRIAALSVMFIVFMFSAWQFMSAKPGVSGPVLASVPPLPIPSTSTQQFISTKTQTRSCEELGYVVQQHETLESIAIRFLTSKEEIQAANNMKTETVVTGMRLIIPLCNLTPTGTVHALTTTFTPVLRPITSTPGG